MGNISTFDFGSSAVKCVVVSKDQDVIFSCEQSIKTYQEDGFFVQHPNDWLDAFYNLSNKCFEVITAESISNIIFSGQMQDLILLDKNANAIASAILYHDQRGESCLCDISEDLKRKIEEKTCNKLDGSIPITKLLWLKKHAPELLRRTYKIGISAKDYIIAKLTGNFVSDFTSLSTGGILEMKTGGYISEISELGIDCDILPIGKFPREICGEISLEMSGQTGYAKGTKVHVGIGDAGATTLASGISKNGEVNINIGTSGWVASISENSHESAFNLKSTDENLMINVVPLLNAGGVHKWIANAIGDKDCKYEDIHNLVKSARAGSGDLLFLPYINGERFPASDFRVRGCYIGVSCETTKGDFAKSALEGVAFSIKQGLESLNIQPKKISIIGGGGKESEWNQIFADILSHEISVFENSQHLSCIAISTLVSNKQLINSSERIYKPNKENEEIYKIAYARFKKIYPCVKDLF